MNTQALANPASAKSVSVNSARLRRDATILLIVDVQEKLSPVMLEAEAFVARCTLLARAARMLQVPIVVTEQNAARLGHTVAAIEEVLGEYEAIDKMLFSACTPKTLERLQELQAQGYSSVLVCGNEAHVCVLQSTLDLLERGFAVFVAHDAIASRRDLDRQIGWQRMMQAGALATTTESAVFELMREAGTLEFKALLPYLK
ncbi:MAG: hypothetical protein JWN98_1986 [Abditibacteriota bacterium]|nr:hypothetical protein [Abditibacteriota bacterium]